MALNDESVAAVILSSDDQEVLLVKRRDTPIWVLPGGGVDIGETPIHAAAREALEETGVVIEVKGLIGKYLPKNKLGKVTYLYLCRPVDGKPQASSEAREAQFFPLSKLPRPFFFIHKKWLDDALEHRPQPFEKPLEGVTYWNFAKHLLCHPLLTARFLLSKMGMPWNSR